MRLRTLVASLVTLVLALFLVFALPMSAGAEEEGESNETVDVHRTGVIDWMQDMEWAWVNATANQHTSVTDEKIVESAHGQYPSWITTSYIEDTEGPDHSRMSGWTKAGHERVFDQVEYYGAEGDHVTVVRQYDPPAPFPFWENLEPGAAVQKDITTYTDYTVAFQPAGSQHTNWTWTAWADDHIYELETPAGTFEGYNISVHKQNQEDEDDESLYRYFYAPAAQHYVATLHGDGSVDFEATTVHLDPPPHAQTRVIPPLPEVGENVTFDARGSFDPHGELDHIEWELPDGTAVEGYRANTTFEEPGTYRAHLTVVAESGRSLTVPVTVNVAEATGTFQLAGPDAAEAGKPTHFRLIVPENSTLKRASWNAESSASQSGEEATFVFPRGGSYNVTVTYVDREGTTGTLDHTVRVVEGSGPGQGAKTGEELADQGLPGFLSPEDEATVEGQSTLIVARTTGLDDPAIILESGLRISLPADEAIVSERVPLHGDNPTLELVDGDSTVDEIGLTVVEGTGQDGQVADAETTDETPAPFLAGLLTILATACLGRTLRP